MSLSSGCAPTASQQRSPTSWLDIISDQLRNDASQALVREIPSVFPGEAAAGGVIS